MAIQKTAFVIKDYNDADENLKCRILNYLHQYQINKNLIEKNKFDITGYCNSYDAVNWHHFFNLL